MPDRIQLRRIAGWRMPPNTISAARPGPLGNPFVDGRDTEIMADRVGKARDLVADSSRDTSETIGEGCCVKKDAVMRADQTQTVEKPFGVVAIFSDKMGRIVASVSDFNRSGYGGFTLLEGQKMRAERALAWEVVRGYCSEMLLDGLEDSDCRKMVRRLVEKGANVTIIPIGHEDAR